jgi:hypothetical protein
METTNQGNKMTVEMMDEYIIKELGMRPTVHEGNATVYEFDSDNTLLFVQLHKDGELIYLTLTQYNRGDKGGKGLYNGWNPTTEDFSKFSEIAKDVIEKCRLETLGAFSNQEEKSYSEKEIRDMIDIALDKRDFDEVDRLSKMLPEEIQKLMETITRIKQLMK